MRILIDIDDKTGAGSININGTIKTVRSAGVRTRRGVRNGNMNGRPVAEFDGVSAITLDFEVLEGGAHNANGVS